MPWPWRGRVTAETQNWLELAGTGATGVKRCLHYEIPEKSRSIVEGASVSVCGKKRKGTGKTGNFTGKSDIITSQTGPDCPHEQLLFEVDVTEKEAEKKD